MTNQKPPAFRDHAEEVAWVLANRAAVEQADGEGAESPDELTRIGKTFRCWDCGSEFVAKDERQSLCVRCYVAGKL
jgi:formylmethanofuran dehydrogenase subunit E